MRGMSGHCGHYRQTLALVPEPAITIRIPLIEVESVEARSRAALWRLSTSQTSEVFVACPPTVAYGYYVLLLTAF